MTKTTSRVGAFVQKSKEALFTDAAQLSAADLIEKHHSSGHKNKSRSLHQTILQHDRNFLEKILVHLEEGENSDRDEALHEKGQRVLAKGRSRVSEKHHHHNTSCNASRSSLEHKEPYAGLGDWGEDPDLFD